MQHITLHRQPSESYGKGRFKVYDAKRNGKIVGTVEQDLYGKWAVVDTNFNRYSHHTTIKAAVRVAGRVLR